MPFDTFLMAMYPGAITRNDTEWYEGRRAGMPVDDREGCLERSKAEYGRRIGMSIDEYMDQWFNAHLAKSLDECIAANSAEILDEIAAANIEDATNHQIMVENFRVFEREYFAMMASRSC